MDWFVAAFWVTMLVGLSAVIVPAYWLASGWWRDREGPDLASVAVAEEVSITPSVVHIPTAGQALAQPIFAATARTSFPDRKRPGERQVPIAIDTSIPAFVRIPTAGEALAQPMGATACPMSSASGRPWRSRSTASAPATLAPRDG